MTYEPGECIVIDSIIFDVWGDPAPQGSKRAFVIKKGKMKGKVAMSEMSKKVKPWRARIASVARTEAARMKWSKQADGPVRVVIQFFMRPPKTPKWKALGRPDRMPDIDKLARSTLDGLSDSGVIYGDDRQVVDLHCIQHYATDGHSPGARINVVSLREASKPIKKSDHESAIKA